MRISTVQNREMLFSHFSKNHTLFAYHIGDLDDFFFPYCKWPVMIDENNEISEAILIYDNRSFSTVMAFGITDNFIELLIDSFSHFPDYFYCHFNPAYRNHFSNVFIEKPLGDFYKMELQSDNFKSINTNDSHIFRLDIGHLRKIKDLYNRAYPDSYFDDRMLETGKYFGYEADNEIIGISGIHVYSKEYKIAVLGNIATDPRYTGRGIATKLTAGLVKELLADVDTITLNVRADNPAAIKCYTKIGFKITHNYVESFLTRKNT